MKQKVLISLITVFIGLFCNAQNGTIKGVITDGRDSTNKPIFGAMVFIPGTTYGAFTGQDGSFTLANVTPGKYDVTISYVLIGEQKVEGVKVLANEETTLNHLMTNPKAKEDEGLILRFKKEETSEETTVATMRDADEVKETVSRDEMSSKGATTIASATKSVTGVSIVEGKYAYIRGLSDRYTKTLLNGSEIPGLDPDRNAVQLDLFPSSFVASMDVVKTFSPNLPGDFAGGLIDIKTLESYDSLTFKISGGLGYNPQANLNGNFLSHDGGSLDWFGMDDGTRNFSDEVNEALDNDDFPTDVLTTQDRVDELVSFSSSMNGNMALREYTSPLNQNLTFSMGNTIRKYGEKDTLNEREYGYFLGVNYRRSYGYFDDGFVGRYEIQNTTSITTEQDPMFSKRAMTFREGQMNVLAGGILAGYVRYNPKHKLSYRLIRNHTGQKKTQLTTGDVREVLPAEVRIRVANFLERAVNTLQLNGEHMFDTLFFGTPTDFNWTSSYSYSTQAQPDLRVMGDEVQNIGGVDVYDTYSASYATPDRFRRSMNQHTCDVKLHFTKEVKSDSAVYKIKSGAGTLFKYRNYEESIIGYGTGSNAFSYNDFEGDLDAYFDPANYGIVDTTSTGIPLAGLTFQNRSSPDNRYTAQQGLFHYYLMGEAPLSDKLTVIAGARAEYNTMKVVTESDITGSIEKLALLPSVNFTYTFYKNKFLYTSADSSSYAKRTMKMKAVYYNTVARPSFREFSPLFLNDFLTGWNILGNPDIEQSSIQNFDLRWEYYPQVGELVAVSAFYKYFKNGIEKATNPGPSDIEGTWKNSDGYVYGIEAEFRRSLSFISNNLKNFKIGINAALMTSETNISEEELANIQAFNPYYGNSRPFFGQSPYLLNGLLQYNNDTIGITANVTFNQFGKRLALVQIKGVPNIFEQARGELNFNISKKIGTRSKITFRAKNLLNPEYKWSYEFRGEGYEEIANYDNWKDNEYVFRSYRKGRRYSVSYSYTF